MGLFDEIKFGKKRIQIKCANMPNQDLYEMGDKIDTWIGDDGLFYGIDLGDTQELLKYIVVVYGGRIVAVFENKDICHNYDGDKVSITEFLNED